MGLVGWWPALASSGGYILRDLAGSDDGSFVNNTTWGMNSQIGPMVSFDGTADKVQLSDDNKYSLDTTGELSVMGWIVATSLAARRNPISKGAASNYEWDISLETDGDLAVNIRQAAGGSYFLAETTSGGVIVVDTLYHVGFTCIEATECRAYVNGVEVGNDTTSSGSYTNGTAAMQLGERADGGNDHAGLIGEVRVYNRSLSASEMWAQYAPETRWDLYLPAQRIWPAVAAAAPAGVDPIPQIHQIPGTVDVVPSRDFIVRL